MSSLINNFDDNSRRALYLLTSKKIWKMTLCAVILLIVCLIATSQCSICSSSTSTSNAITSEQCSFSEYTSTKTYNVASGTVSSSLYYLFVISTPYNCAIRKANPNGSSTWIAALSLNPIVKSLSVDTLELYVYVASYFNPLNVVRLGAETGAIVDAQRHSFLNGVSYDIKIHLLSDGSGYYVTGADSANSSMFMLGVDPSSPYQLHLYKHTFGSISPNWCLKLLCPSGTCTIYYSESLLISSTIYTFFPYGSSIHYLYMAAISLSDGTVSNRYKSSTSCTNVWGSGVNGDYIAASVVCSSDHLLIFNRATNLFDIKSFSGTYLYGIGLDITGRFAFNGQLNNNGYTAKIISQSISAHPEFQITAIWTMNLLLSGTDDIVADSGQTIGTTTTQTVSSPAYTNQTVTFVPGISYTSDVRYLIADQKIYAMENSATQILPDLTCSNSGSTSISFSISNYMTSTVPSWVAFDSISGILSINAPEVSLETEYHFFINSAVNGASSPIQKLIKLIIINCSAKNCKKCISTNSLTCETCVSDYILTSGVCEISKTTSSETAKALSKTTTSTVIAITGIVVLASILNTTSIANLWMTINQLQLFFLLLLTRAFLSKDIRDVIEGSDFASNIYGYFPGKNLQIYPSFLNKFEFELVNLSLKPFGINYGSTLANIYPILAFTFFMIIITFSIFIIKLIFTKCCCNERRSCMTKVIFWITDRLYRIFTFGFFIRNILELSQFILISSINEIYESNTEDSYRLISFAFSILILLIFILMIALIQYLTFSSYSLNENEHNKLEEFFRGLQFDGKHKFYTTVLLLRRLIFIVLLITCVSISSRTLIVILSLIQIGPYKDSKGNLIEILNEFYFCFLIIYLIAINTENEWSILKEKIYLYVLVSNTFVIFMIDLAFLFKEPCKCIYRNFRRCIRSRENDSQVIPMQILTIARDDSNQIIQMRDISHGGIRYRVSKHPIQVTISDVNLNLSNNAHSGL